MHVPACRLQVVTGYRWGIWGSWESDELSLFWLSYWNSFFSWLYVVVMELDSGTPKTEFDSTVFSGYHFLHIRRSNHVPVHDWLELSKLAMSCMWNACQMFDRMERKERGRSLTFVCTNTASSSEMEEDVVRGSRPLFWKISNPILCKKNYTALLSLVSWAFCQSFEGKQ